MEINAGSDASVNIDRLVRIFRRRIPWVLASFLSLMALWYVLAPDPVLYVSSVVVRLPEPEESSVFDSGSALPADQVERAIAAQKELILSPELDQIVDDQLGSPAADFVDSLTVTTSEDALLMSVTVRSTSPDVARVAADTYADAYIEAQHDAAERSLRDRASQIRDSGLRDDEAAQVGTELQEIELAIARKGGEIARTLRDFRNATNDPDAGELEAAPELVGEREGLARQRDALLGRQARLFDDIESLLQQAERLEIDADYQGARGAEIIASSSEPVSEGGSASTREALVVALAAAVVSLAVGYVRDLLDNRVRESSEVAELVSAPILGRIPKIAQSKPPAVHVVTRSGSVVAESFRAARTDLVVHAMRTKASIIAFAEAVPGGIRSVVVSNLGVTLARFGARVTIVSCDLRMPILHRLFGFDLDPGLTEVLSRKVDIEQALRECPGIGGQGLLSVLPSGQPPSYPAEILGSHDFPALLENLRARFDYVLLDLPPVLSLADALIVGQHADAMVISVPLGRVTREALVEAADRVRGAGVPLLGTIVTNVTSRDRPGQFRGSHAGSQMQTSGDRVLDGLVRSGR